ncbi:uncharacterized [Tachysurus ichikawai]
MIAERKQALALEIPNSFVVSSRTTVPQSATSRDPKSKPILHSRFQVQCLSEAPQRRSLSVLTSHIITVFIRQAKGCFCEIVDLSFSSLDDSGLGWISEVLQPVSVKHH